MAGSALSFGLSNAVNLQNDVVLRCRNLFISDNSGFKMVKEVTFDVRPLNLAVKKQRLVVRSSHSEAKPQVVTSTADKNEGSGAAIPNDIEISEKGNELETDVGGNDGGDLFDGNGGSGKFPGGDGGGGSGEDGEDKDEKEFGPLMKFDEVMKEANARGAQLPSDMLEAAKSVGIRKVLLTRYLDLQGSGGLLGFAMKSCPMLRNRMLADPSFLFKIGAEIVIDSVCATFAEVQKRGKDFWAEFELYVADLLVGTVVNVALVGMLAPYARIGQLSVSKGYFGQLRRFYDSLPSSVFEAERPECSFSVEQRIATFFCKGVLYASVGFACGIIGQGIANLIMTAKRSMKKSEDDIPVPPLLKSAVLWGGFLAVSSNFRYQLINGLERVVEASPQAKQVPAVAKVFTIIVRYANNVYGGMQFVDLARQYGVQ